MTKNTTHPTLLESLQDAARDSRFAANRAYVESPTADNELRCLFTEARIEALDEAAALVIDLRRLAASLTREADKLEREPLSGSTNSLGVVQGAGLDIDRRCAVLRERIAAFRVLAKSSEKFNGAEGL